MNPFHKKRCDVMNFESNTKLEYFRQPENQLLVHMNRFNPDHNFDCSHTSTHTCTCTDINTYYTHCVHADTPKHIHRQRQIHSHTSCYSSVFQVSFLLCDLNCPCFLVHQGQASVSFVSTQIVTAAWYLYADKPDFSVLISSTKCSHTECCNILIQQ